MSANASAPLVAVLSRVPLVHEALAPAFAGIARVERFASATGAARFLSWLRPHAVVVDCDELAQQAAEFAAGTETPVVHISLSEPRLRVLVDGRWSELEEPASPEAVRDLVVGVGNGRLME